MFCLKMVVWIEHGTNKTFLVELLPALPLRFFAVLTTPVHMNRRTSGSCAARHLSTIVKLALHRIYA